MSSGSLRNQAYRHIQGKILSGELPAGERLSEQALAEEVGISRTPVRSAIRQLETEGLLEQIPRYGTIVKKLDRRELAELYEMRVALEGFAAESVAGSLPADDLFSLSQLCDEMQAFVKKQLPQVQTDDPDMLARLLDADMQLHLIILRGTGNRQLMKSVAGSRMLSQWGQFARKQHDLRLLAGAWEQHRSIVDALQAGDAERARRAMVRHIRISKDLALALFDRLEAEGHARELMHWTGAAGQLHR